jgi:DnaK suppressor protein
MVKISKTYIPKEKEKYMCAKHLAFFKKKLTDWKVDLIKTNNEALYNSSMDDNSTSADIVDQASSYTEKNVEMRAINRQIKLISKIDSALKRIKDGTYGFCEETGEPIGLKRLMARPVATLSIEAQEKHEKEEKIFADN